MEEGDLPRIGSLKVESYIQVNNYMKRLLGFIFFLVCFFVTTTPVFAVTVDSIGIATYLPVNGKVENGNIISSNSNGYGISSKEYDPQIVGVATTNPAISLKLKGEKEGVPVINVGTVLVKVIGINGNIKRGDMIATSNVPGVGMKSTKNGYVIGQAIEDVSFNKPTDIKTVSIAINLHFLQRGSPTAGNSIWQIFQLSQIATYEEPLKVFRYVASAIVLIMSFAFGFFIFSKAINTGIEALGRNPLAGRMIQLSILFNVVLVIIIIMTGIGITYLFLRI
jgi:hypothetical protein